MSEKLTPSKLWRASGKPGKFKDFLKQYNANGGTVVIIEEEEIPVPTFQGSFISNDGYYQDNGDDYSNDINNNDNIGGSNQFFIPPSSPIIVAQSQDCVMDTKTLVCIGMAGVALGMAAVLIIRKIK